MLSGANRHDTMRALILASLAVTTASLRPPEAKVAIAGGGLSGLALAVALKSAGIDVLVLEKAPALRTKSQGAMRLTTAGLADLGAIYASLPDTLRSVGAQFDQVIFKHAMANGTVTSRSDSLGSSKGAALVAWADVQNALADAIREVSAGDDSWLRCGAGVKSYNEKADHVEIELDDGSVVTASLLIGADGAFSAVRRQLTRPWPDRPRSYSQTNWNAIVPRDSVPEEHRVPERTSGVVTYELSGAPAMLYALDIGNNRTFWQLRVTDEKIAKAVDPSGRGGAGLPGVQQRVLDVVDQAARDAPDADFGELRAFAAASDHDIFERRILDRKPLRRWSSRGRRVVIVGDAAHAMHPASGQGANSAFADVVALAAALKSGDLDHPAAAVKAFEKARVAIANEVQARSRVAGLGQAAGKLSTDRGSWARRVAPRLLRWRAAKYRRKSVGV